jgi:hypothetical protein
VNHNQVEIMKISTSLTLMVLMSITVVVKGQDSIAVNKSSKWDVGLEGMLGISFGNDFYAMNVGGPTLFVNLNKDLKFGIGALPSLYLLNGKLGARLGVAPRIDYKNLVLFAPFFHMDRTDRWIWSVGFGYKFHKRKAS